jgi:hypothetical protein
MVYFNVSIMYFNVFESIWVYLNVLECIWMYLECIWMYLNIFIVYLNVFECIHNVFEYISMCLNVFIDIVIEFHHHFLIITFLPCTPTYTFFFSLYTMTPFPTCYTTTFLFFPFPLIHSNFHTIYTYFSRLYITPHSKFHILCRH